MSPDGHKMQLTLSPSPAHTSPPRIPVTQSPENTGLQARVSRDDTLTKIFPFRDSRSAAGRQKYKNRGRQIFLPKTCQKGGPRSPCHCCHLRCPLSPSWKLAPLCLLLCASVTAVALICLHRT